MCRLRRLSQRGRGTKQKREQQDESLSFHGNTPCRTDVNTEQEFKFAIFAQSIAAYSIITASTKGHVSGELLVNLSSQSGVNVSARADDLLEFTLLQFPGNIRSADPAR